MKRNERIFKKSVLPVFFLNIIFFMILNIDARHEISSMSQLQPPQQQKNSTQQSQQNSNQGNNNLYSSPSANSSNNTNYSNGSNNSMNQNYGNNGSSFNQNNQGQNNQNNQNNFNNNDTSYDDDSDDDFSDVSLNDNLNQGNSTQYNNNNNQSYNSGNYQGQSQDFSQQGSTGGQNIPSLNSSTASCDPSDPSCAQAAAASCDPNDPSCSASQDNSGGGGGDSGGPSSFVTSIQNNPVLAVLGAVGAVGGIFMMIEPIKGAIGWIRKKLNSGERVKYEEAAEIINKKYKAKADLVDEQIDNVTMSRTLPPEVKTALIRNLKAQKSAYIEANNAVQESLKNAQGETTVNAKIEGEKLDAKMKDIETRITAKIKTMKDKYGYDVDINNEDMVADNEAKYREVRQVEVQRQRQQKEVNQKEVQERKSNGEGQPVRESFEP